MQNKYIYIDESGDTGYTKKSTKYFILTAVMVDDPFILRRIAKSVHRGKRDKKKANILHAHSETNQTKNKLIMSLKKSEISCIVAMFKKTKIENVDIYFYVLEKIAQHIKSFKISELVIAKRDTRRTYNQRIISMFKFYGINIVFSEMCSEKALQIADFYSWCIFTYLEYENPDYFLKLSDSIIII
jgi:hypothetical protein